MSFLLQWFYLLALAIWVGSIVFFSFFTTPTLFTQLPREMASQIITVIFPRYYALGYACGAVLLLTSLIEAALMRQWPLIRLALVALMLGSTLYAGMVLRPEVHELKIQMKTVEEGTDLGIRLKGKFDRAHRLSVILNMVVLISGLFLLGIVAFRLRL
jgi:hypothetical protein